jgi:hypothetical protein
MFRLAIGERTASALRLPSSLRLNGIPRRGWQNSSGDPHRGRARGHVGDDQTVGGYHGPIANRHRANDGTVAADEDVVTYGSATWPRPCADRAYVVDGTISPDLGVTMHSDEADVRNKQARANLRVRMKIDVRHHRKQLVYDADNDSGRHPKPSGSALTNYFVKSMDDERPKAL